MSKHSVKTPFSSDEQIDNTPTSDVLGMKCDLLGCQLVKTFYISHTRWPHTDLIPTNTTLPPKKQRITVCSGAGNQCVLVLPTGGSHDPE